MNVLISKGCTPMADQDVLIREHRAGPGIAIVSYTHVCRQKDNCNSMSTSLPLWTLPSTTGVRGLGRGRGSGAEKGLAAQGSSRAEEWK